MIPLTDAEALLAKILESSNDERSSLRTLHAQHTGLLDGLEHDGSLLHAEGRYHLSLLAIDDLRLKRILRADNIHQRCTQLYPVLRRLYTNAPGRKFTIAEISREAGLPVSLVQKTLVYLNQAPIWTGHDGPIFGCTALAPSAEVLRYTSLNALIAKLRSDREATNRPTEGTRIKDQKFRILDSPALLEADLQNPAGLLGRAVIYLDLDDFKTLNTRLTEVIVDRLVLPPLHRCLADCVAGIGHAYAEGGDEFTVLLPNTSEEMAEAAAKAMKNQIQALRFELEARDVRLRASFGVAHATVGEPEIDLRKLANEAKRVSKSNGKNCISINRDRGKATG